MMTAAGRSVVDMAGFERKEYSAAAVKHAFWFMEFRKEVQLLGSGKSFEEIKELNRSENIFGCPTQARATQIYNTVSARIQSLDSSFYPVFLNGDLPTQKLFALVAAMNYDTLLFDLVYEVVREKMIIGSYELADSDVRIFFKDKQQQSEKAAVWTEETCAKLSTSYKSMLFEAGLTDKAKKTRKVLKPILEHSMEDWLTEHGLGIMIDALTGVR